MPDAPSVSRAPTAAPAAPTAQAATAPRIVGNDDPRWARTPMTRLALTIIIPNSTPPKYGAVTKLAIRETKIGGRVEMIEDVSGNSHALDLNCTELRRLAEHANRIARIVSKRPDWKP
jgi:hypothetical protein